MDIRQFLKEGTRMDDHNSMNVTFANNIVIDEPVDKMRLIRNKMVEARMAADRDKAKESKIMKEPMRKWGEEDVIHARDVNNIIIKDSL